jgi:hypothetical protein
MAYYKERKYLARTDHRLFDKLFEPGTTTPYSVAGGQVSPQRLEAIRSRLHQAKVFFDKMPETRRQALSSAAQNLIHLAKV